MNALILAMMLAGGASSMTSRVLDPMLPAIAADLGRTLHEAALLASATSLPYAALQLVLGAVSDAFGKARLILLSTGLMAVGMVLSVIAPDFITLLLSRVVTGAFAGGIFPIALALVGDRTSVDQRQIALSRLLMIALLGQLVGASMGGLLVDIIGWRAVLAINATVAGVGWLAAFAVLRNSDEPRRSVTVATVIAGYRAVLANPVAPALLGIVAIEGVIAFGLFPFVAPMLLERRLGGAFEAGVIIGGFSIGGVLYTLTIRQLVAHFGQLGMIRIGGVLVGVAYIATAAPLPWQFLVPLYLVAGFGYFMMHNTLQTRATELAPAVRGACLALFAGCLVGGSALGPVVGAQLSLISGYWPLFAGGGVLYFVCSIYIARVLSGARQRMTS